MLRKRPVRKADIAVILVSVAFVLTNLAAVGTSGRERAKRTVCLSNPSAASLRSAATKNSVSKPYRNYCNDRRLH